MHLVRYPGFFRTLGHRLGDGLADIILDRIAPPPPSAFQQVIAAAPALFGLVKLLREAPPPSAPLSPDEIVSAANGTPSPIPGSPPREVGPAPEQTCVPPSPAKGSKNAYQDTAHASLVREIDKIRGEASWKSGDFLPLHILLDDISALGVVARSADALPGESKIATVARLLRDRGRGDTYEEIRQLVDAVGNRHDGVKTVVAAATIIRDADAFIAKQAEAIRALTDQVRELILDSEFSPGRGEVGIILTEAEAKAIDDRGNVPHGELVTLVLRDHRWTIRVKHVAEAALKPGDATPPNPTYVHLRVKQDVVAALLFARDQMPQADQTDMAQNAAGGVA